MRKRDEELFATLCHLFNAIPVWGMIFNGLALFWSRETSRNVSRQASQAIFFHALMLFSIIVWSLVELITHLIGIVFGPLGGILHFFNSTILFALMVLYWGTCAWAAFQTYNGVSFRYPLVGDAWEPLP